MNERKFAAIFYDYTLNQPIPMDLESEEKFAELCEYFPTQWAHLMVKETGEVVYSWSNEPTSWRNN